MSPRAGRPVILAVCDHPGDVPRLEREPRTRHEADYRLVFEGSAIGEGSIAIQQVHEYLSQVRPRARR